MFTSWDFCLCLFKLNLTLFFSHLHLSFSFSLSLFLSFFLSPFVIFGHLLESRRQAPQMKSSVAFITHNRLFGIGFQPAFRASDKRYEREKEIGMNRPDLWPNACACSLPISLDASQHLFSRLFPLVGWQRIYIKYQNIVFFFNRSGTNPVKLTKRNIHKVIHSSKHPFIHKMIFQKKNIHF